MVFRKGGWLRVSKFGVLIKKYFYYEKVLFKS